MIISLTKPVFTKLAWSILENEPLREKRLSKLTGRRQDTALHPRRQGMTDSALKHKGCCLIAEDAMRFFNVHNVLLEN